MHEISVQNGVAEAAYSTVPPWHGLGFVSDSPMTIEQALLHSRLGSWTVQSAPLFLPSGKEVEGWKANVRSDSGAVLGVVTDAYQIVQNVDSFSVLGELEQAGDLRIESAGALRNGAITWVLTRLPGDLEVQSGDTTRRYLLFTNGHDGRWRFTATNTLVRVVCMNTLSQAIRNAEALLSFAHKGDVKSKLQKLCQIIARSNEQFSDFSVKAHLLRELKPEPVPVRTWIDRIFPPPSKLDQEPLRQEKISTLRELYKIEVKAFGPSWWGLFNSFTALVDHHKRRKGSVLRAQESRFQDILFGPGSEAKSRAFGWALELSGARVPVRAG
jgi:phage/plasmid-like protein (TIGR03299 family)